MEERRKDKGVTGCMVTMYLQNGKQLGGSSKAPGNGVGEPVTVGKVAEDEATALRS